jgi:DNA processing protein
MERYRHWLALKRIAGVGNVLYKRLLEAFNAPEAVFSANEAALLGVNGVTTETAAGILEFHDFEWVDRELEQIEKVGASLLTLSDPEYPPLLAAIYDPPPYLYIKGRWEVDRYPIAVVGSRKTTPYGKTVTERLCHDLVGYGMTIVSGFARGIDGFAHQAALSAGGRTIAVFGCGIDHIYPPEHAKLFEEIEDQGAILSEFPIGAQPDARHFPQRNRIISGLSLGCVVVEAALESGSLITARFALEQGREVFAVPGPIYSETSAGTHQLIGSGAKLIMAAEDILEELLPALKRAVRAPEALTPLESEEEALFCLLSLEPKHIDQVIFESARTPSAVSGLLLALEL